MYYYKRLHRIVELSKIGMSDLSEIDDFTNYMKKLLTYRHFIDKKGESYYIFNDYEPLRNMNGRVFIDMNMYHELNRFFEKLEQEELHYLWIFYLKKILDIEVEDLVLEKYL